MRIIRQTTSATSQREISYTHDTDTHTHTHDADTHTHTHDTDTQFSLARA